MVGYLNMSSLEGGANEPRLELSLVKKRVTQQQDGGDAWSFLFFGQCSYLCVSQT